MTMTGFATIKELNYFPCMILLDLFFFMLASWLIASRRMASLEVAGDNAAYMCPHVSSTLLPGGTLHYLTLSQRLTAAR